MSEQPDWPSADLLQDYIEALDDARFKLDSISRDTDLAQYLDLEAPRRTLTALVDPIGDLTDEVNELEHELQDLFAKYDHDSSEK